MLTQRLSEPLATIVSTFTLVVVVMGLVLLAGANIGPFEFLILAVVLTVIIGFGVRSVLTTLRARRQR